MQKLKNNEPLPKFTGSYKKIMFEVLKPHQRYIFSYKKEREARTLDLISYWVNNLKTFYFYLGGGGGWGE